MSSPLSPQAAAAELLRRRRGRDSLVGFSQAIEIPGKPVSEDEDADDWLFLPVETGLALHHLLLLQAIERTAKKHRGRLMVFMPPGSAKSTYCSVVAPAYLMAQQRERRFILASYATPLARRLGRRARQIARSPSFASLFGCTISTSTSAAHEWALTNGSEYLAGGILSGITGNRAHGIFVDDPIKGRQQADSETIRQTTWDAFNDDLLTRLIPGGFVVIVQTRWHEDDIAGRLLPKGYDGRSGLIRCNDGDDWEVLCLPAQCERWDDPLGRKPGEFIWPEWFGTDHWSPFMRNARTWSALFQQRPAPGEGGTFKRQWFRDRYGAIPAAADVCVHSWDTAQKDGERNDPTAGGVYRLGRGVQGYYLAEVTAERLEYPDLKRKVIAYAKRDNPRAVLIEDKGSGTSLIQDLRSSTSIPVIAIEPCGSKLFRADDVSPTTEAGLVHLPESAPWLADFEREFFSFPLATHDDQVDQLTQFLKWVENWTFTISSASTGPRESAVALAEMNRTGGYTTTRRASAETSGY
nr:phage terminase large subunit [Methyloversatilis sp. XJ19-49]